MTPDPDQAQVEAQIQQIRAWAEDEYSLLRDRDLRADIQFVLAHLAAVQQERDAAVAMNVTIESMQLERMNAVAAVEKEKVAAEQRAEHAEAQLAALTAELTRIRQEASYARNYVAAIMNDPDVTGMPHAAAARAYTILMEEVASTVPASSDGHKE